MPYLTCPRCGLTLYKGVAYAYPSTGQCPRCSESVDAEPKRLLAWRRLGAEPRPLRSAPEEAR